MTWVPANLSSICQQYPTATTCHSSVLTLLTFIVQNFGHSYDTNFSDNTKNHNIENEDYDFIIVGGGTAGCVVANRLSEIKQWKVLVLEAGDEEPVVVDVPGLYTLFPGSSVDWKYKSQFQNNACKSTNNICSLPRGKVLGGSSSINGMVYVRGNRENYNDWSRLGNEGWSYKDVLPYFLKSENNQYYQKSRLHSTKGPLTINYFPNDDKVNIQVLIDAWKELGYPQVDYNSYRQIGVSQNQHANINGARLSMNGAFIRPIRGRRPNLTIKLNTLATKILIDPKSKQAIGVEYSTSGDKKNLKRVFAKKEVILSAGVFESPKLLMLSGIGHTNELKKANIDVIQDLPVGDNFHDHVIAPVLVGILNKTSTVIDIDTIKDDLVYWKSTHLGALSSTGSISDVNTFDEVKYYPHSGVPNIQHMYFGSRIQDIDLSRDYNGIGSYVPKVYYDCVLIAPTLLNPKSRGTVRLNVTDPIWSHPIIQPNYLKDQNDIETIVNAAVKSIRLFDTHSFKKLGITKYTKLVKGCEKYKFESRDYFKCVAETSTRPGLHLVGTCKMGPQNDTGAVVDPKLRVYGIKNLRVIDASIMPIVPSGNTFTPTVMIGEKGSDLIKENWLKKK